MAYRTIAEKQLPIGSGAMESAIRRVVNLRLKGAGIYWCRQTAEAMLMLRSYFKIGALEYAEKVLQLHQYWRLKVETYFFQMRPPGL